MEGFRSRSCGHRKSQMESYNGSQVLQCLIRGVCAPQQQQTQAGNNGKKIRKGKSANGSVTKSWSLSDLEIQRKKRVASNKVYTVEGKLKGSLQKRFMRRGCTDERREIGGQVERERTKGWVGERRGGGLGGIGGMEGLGGIVGGGVRV
ncbi:hypothetical protein ACFXTH_007810 [Malus domestica]